jgi:Cys-rich protein (TIGR01571 family)
MMNEPSGGKHSAVPLEDFDDEIVELGLQKPASSTSGGEKKNVEHENKGHRIVTLVAPSDLPPDYRLPIVYVNADGVSVNGFCRIPEGGVYRGQEVQCELIVPQPVMGKWSQDIFDCCKNMDSSFFCLSWFCGPVAWACLYEKSFKMPYGSWWVAMLVLYVLARALNFMAHVQAQTPQPDPTQGAILAQIASILFFAITVLMVGMRSGIRSKFQIPGNWCEDCLCVSFCTCCSAIQAQQHLKLNHQSPDLCPCCKRKTTAELMIV